MSQIQVQDVKFLIKNFDNEWTLGFKNGKTKILTEREAQDLQTIFNKQRELMERDIDVETKVRGFSWAGKEKPNAVR